MPLLAAMAVATAMLPDCEWNKPGHDPYMKDVPSAVDDYTDIPKPIREKLKARMAYPVFDYDDTVFITRGNILGKAFYSAEITQMHFGSHGQICKNIDRSKWKADDEQFGLVYCEGVYCIVVPTVCRNVARITRFGPPPPKAAPPTIGPARMAARRPAYVAQAALGRGTPCRRNTPGCPAARVRLAARLVLPATVAVLASGSAGCTTCSAARYAAAAYCAPCASRTARAVRTRAA